MIRTQLPLIITFFTGMLLIVTFFIPHKPFGDLEQRFLIWYSIISGFTVLLGLDSLVKYHLTKLKKEFNIHSFILLFSLFLTLILGFYSWFKFKTPFALNSPFMYLYTYVIIPLQATMFALLAFFIASAAYRAFRARTFEATLLLIAATIVMLGRVPIGSYIWKGIASFISTIFPKIPYEELAKKEIFALISDWIMNIPQNAAKRGIFIGTALGGIAMSIRIILGIERTYITK
ncbi:MAG: hypothetical protein N2323_05395 [candidate division WOR-3 bacterium]|nr:hypothetical protein [candidate division WOR-3 bacterium]MCX7837374.1 hypothetical protein [candidate division WOR-3 bacterium]MDW8114011.1 hypothetical protein [candidate division WOR-3 bacterium]